MPGSRDTYDQDAALHFLPPRLSSCVIGLAAFFSLNALLVAPDLLLGLYPAQVGYYLSFPTRLFSLDLFVLVAVPTLFLSSGLQQNAWRVTVTAVPLLLIYEIYDAAIQTAFHRSPIFRADLPHVWGAIHLLFNTLSPLALAGIGAALGGGLAVLIWGLPRIARSMHDHAAHSPLRRGIVVTAVVLVGLHVARLWVGFGSLEYRSTYVASCLSTTECAVRNASASADLSQDLTQRLTRPADSTYLRYDRLSWSDPPYIYLVMIESYGSVVSTHPDLTTTYTRLMNRVEDSLRSSGWTMASSTSTSPVFGGLSWLAIAETFLGTPVRHQPTLEILRPKIPRYPHLIDFLADQGYRTAALQPPVRPRPGLRVDNRYGFDRTFYFDDLDYAGPHYGFGMIPDEYSLHAAHEAFVSPAADDNAPFFLFFETTAPHAPWEESAPYVAGAPDVLDHWRAPSESFATVPGPSESDPLPVSDSVRAALADADRWDLSSNQPAKASDRFFDLLAYDWTILTRYLQRQAPSNSLVVILGDHQPRFDTSGSNTTPIHILSRQSDLVHCFEQEGFHPGLHPRSPPSEGASLRHGGLYSLLVRAITSHQQRQTASVPLPPLRPRGVRNTALRPAP